MHVLHLIQRFPPAIGGAEAWCEGVVRHQARCGHRVEVLTLRVLDECELWSSTTAGPKELAVGRVDLEPGVRVRRCRPSRTAYALVRAGERFGVRVTGRYSAELFGLALAAARKASVVHLHHCWVPLSFWGLVAARLARRPAVITPHFHPGEPLAEQPAARWLLRQCDAIVAVSPYEASLFVERGVEPSRVVVSSNAVELPPFDAVRDGARARLRARWGLGGETRLITFVGRKSPEKEITVLIEAAGRLSARMDVALVLAGPAADPTYSVAAPSGLRMIDLPAIPESAKLSLLAASDVLVQPSRREAFGIVFLEAWASRIPVVGAAAGAIPHVVRDAGLCFTPGDASDLAAKLGWLLSHPEEGRRMALLGRERVAREHTWERVGAAVGEAYALAVARRRPRPSAGSGLPEPSREVAPDGARGRLG